MNNIKTKTRTNNLRKSLICMCLAILLSLLANEIKAQARETRAENVRPTEPFDKTQIEPQLIINYDDQTKEVHFIRDNNDPYVVTKVYFLKHAEPYEIKRFMDKVAISNRINGDQTAVECIKYNDGACAMIVAAEEYKFKPNPNCMSIDQIVEMLDIPKIVNFSGTNDWFYFPKYWNARDLAKVIAKVGANVAGDPSELMYGDDTILVDPQLNCLAFDMPPYSQKNVLDMLKLYDTPNFEVSVNYRLIEIYAENDGKIGLDFQAWKNNDGADFFSAGGRYRSGWSSTWQGGADGTGSSKTEFINFNPKWNTRYLDFLVARGKAKIITRGQIAVKNRKTARIESKTRLFAEEEGEKIPDRNLIQGYMALTGQDFVTGGTAPAAGVSGDYMIQAMNDKGDSIDFDRAFNGNLTIVRVLSGNLYSYTMKITEGDASFQVQGKDLGKETNVYVFSLMQCQDTSPPGSAANRFEWINVSNWQNGINLKDYKDYKIETVANEKAYGFSMTLDPSICTDSSILDLRMVNDSLIGWNSDGSPRVSRDGEFKTKLQIGNEGREFVIGGLTRKSVVKSENGIPYLKDIPVLGLLFSTESVSTKNSQLVLVMQCIPLFPGSRIPKDVFEDISLTDKNLDEESKSLPFPAFDNYRSKKSEK